MSQHPSDEIHTTHAPGNPDVPTVEAWLNERFGPRWLGWYAEDSGVRDTALFAQMKQNEAGRWMLTGLLLLGESLTADKLRTVPVTALENSSNLSATQEFRAAVDALPPLKRTAEMSPEDFSRLVAEHYNTWARFVPHPAAAIAAEWDAKVPTVHTWIREARLRGFLPAGTTREGHGAVSGRRRANGEGSVYQRASDGLWVGAVVLPDTGKRKVVYGKTERSVLAERRRVLRDIEDGLPVSSRAPGTIGAWIEGEWLGVTLPGRVAAGTLSPDTLDSYADNWRLHIAPSLADVRWDKLTPARIRSWQTALLSKTSARGKPLSARTVAYCHAIARKALNDAMRDEVPGLRRNVVSLVEPPKVARGGKGRPLDVEQVAAVLAAIEADPLRVLWLTYLGLGLRRGEGLALRWSRVDLDSRHRAHREVAQAASHQRGHRVWPAPRSPGGG